MSLLGKLSQAGAMFSGRNQLRFDGAVFSKTVVTTLNTAGPVTYTADQLIGGLIRRDPNGAARTDTTPTAAQLLSAVRNARIGTSFRFTLINTADAAENLTLAAGTGVTLVGTTLLTQNASTEYLVVFTNVNSPAVTFYSLW